MSGLVYKYAPINSWTLQNLRTMQFCCRHFLDFNDPFEFWAHHCSGVPDPFLERERFLQAMAASGYPDEPLEELLEMDNEDFFQSLADSVPDLSKYFDHTRITCFSGAADNLLMWSHYADGLRGLCLCFDETKLSEHHGWNFVDVVYTDKPAIVDRMVYAIASDQFDYCSEYGHEEAAQEALALMRDIHRAAFATKPIEWKYEQEKRLLIDADGGKEPAFHTYGPEALVGIILGERMPDEHKTTVKSLVSEVYGSIPVKTARRMESRYAIEIA